MTDPTPPKRYDNPARDAWVASVGDPAFDREHEAWPALRDRYVDTRSVADLAALPTLPGQWPTLWRARALSVGARATCYSATSVAAQRLNALRFGLVSQVDGPRAYEPAEGRVSGCAEKPFDVVPGAVFPQAADAGLDALAALVGGDGLDELADVILHRADSNPRRLLPFPLPPRSALL